MVMTAIATIAVIVVVTAAFAVVVMIVSAAMVVMMLVTVTAAMIMMMVVIMVMVFMAVLMGMAVIVLPMLVVMFMFMFMDMSRLYSFLFHWLPLPFFHNVVKGHSKNLTDVGIVQRVVNHSPLLAAFNDPGNLQQPQLVADSALVHPQQRRQVAYAHFLDVQRTDNPGPGTIPKDLEELGHLVNRLFIGHFFLDADQYVLMDDADLAYLYRFSLHISTSLPYP
jgi:hypothetical protein